MSNRQAEILALRRQLLVLQAGLQRVHLGRDTRSLLARSNPLTLVWRWRDARAKRRTLPLLAVFAVAAWRHWFGTAPH
jgi:hypothetical protein